MGAASTLAKLRRSSWRNDVYFHASARGPELALELEEHGYAWIKDRVAPEKVA